jgi:hypothetical protein
MIVERRIQFFDASAPPSPHAHDIFSTSQASSHSPHLSSSPSSQLQQDTQHSKTIPYSKSQSTFQSSSSPLLPDTTDEERHTLTHDSPLLLSSPHAELPSKTITTSVAGVESSGRFALDDNGVWTKTLTFQWPAAKSSSRWAIGETTQSETASVRFFARVKVSSTGLFIFLSLTPFHRSSSLLPLVQNPSHWLIRNFSLSLRMPQSVSSQLPSTTGC